MNLLGVPVSLWIGPTVPVPPPIPVMEALERIEVSSNDSSRSGFQITFRAGRGSADLIDDSLLTGPLLQPFSRVLMTITFTGVPEVLMDGIITNRELAPGNEPGTSTLTVTGEDVSIMMDLEERSLEHPAQPEMIIALKIIAGYPQYGLIPMVIPPPSVDMPLPIERTPTQQETDLEYLRTMADRFAYVFYVVPGPAPFTNTAYWGPPVRVGVPQRALSVSLGPLTNVNSINFRYNGLSASSTEGSVQDRRLNQKIPIPPLPSARIPLSRQPAGFTQRHTRVRRLRGSGLDATQALTRALAETDQSMDEVLTATGELDALRYEGLLKPRGLVGLRGVGDTHSGFYYVKDVNHSIRKGSYQQSFTLTREGTGAISPVVVP